MFGSAATASARRSLGLLSQPVDAQYQHGCQQNEECETPRPPKPGPLWSGLGASGLKAPQRGERPFERSVVHDRHRHRNERKTGLVGERIYALSVKRDEEALNERPIGGLENLLHEKVSALPNAPRLGCGALMKDSFPNLRAPTASSAC